MANSVLPKDLTQVTWRCDFVKVPKSDFVNESQKKQSWLDFLVYQMVEFKFKRNDCFKILLKIPGSQSSPPKYWADEEFL